MQVSSSLSALAAEGEPGTTTPTNLPDLLTSLPVWFWLLLGGALVVVILVMRAIDW